MTTTTAIRYIACLAFLLMAGSLVGVTVTHASEVTGTLSSETASNLSANGSVGGTVANDTQESGNISGTVTGESGGGGGGSSGGSNSRSNGSTNGSSGEVLGAAINTVVPGFPNAGFVPDEETLVSTLWSRITVFFSTVSLMH